MGIPKGTRVAVYDGSGEKYLGEGTYVGDVRVYYVVMYDGSIRSLKNAEEQPDLTQIQGAIEVRDDENPKIVLDSGPTVYGCQVWWEPLVPERTKLDAVVSNN